MMFTTQYSWYSKTHAFLYIESEIESSSYISLNVLIRNVRKKKCISLY